MLLRTHRHTRRRISGAVATHTVHAAAHTPCDLRRSAALPLSSHALACSLVATAGGAGRAAGDDRPLLLGRRAVSYTHLRAHETEADL
eukprot:366121-Rhodomonas_salina.1